MDKSPHKSDFVNVNGISLHYLDWGGEGDALLFLAGMGCHAHIFDNFAPRFMDKFHVMALTRRGHGQSDHPETGYDIDTLTDDIRQFMHRVGIEKVILAGHSLAGLELSRFSALYPERVIKVVFLDAAFDYTSAGYKDMLEKNPLLKFQPPGANDDHYSIEDYITSTKRAYPALAAIWSELLDEHVVHEVEIASDGKVIDRMTDAIAKALREQTINSYTPEHSRIYAPVLSIFAISNGGYFISDDWMTETQRAEVNEFFDTTQASWLRGNIEQFRQNVPHAKIVEIPQGHHYCFIKQEELVYEEMQKFLWNQPAENM